ncbi:MAG: NYN domain-containing protein [Nanoarchaeota archaeon]
MKQTILFVDAGYLSYISKFFGGGKSLRYKIEDFAKNVCKSFNLECHEIFFYIAPPFQSPRPTEEENKRKANYDRFIERLKVVKPKIHIREGRLQKINGSFAQKGVDTLITMDLLKTAIKKEVEEIVIITSDTDFVPIINDIRKNEGIKVNLAYYTDRKRKSAFSLSNHLWKAVDKKLLIKKEYFK